MLVILALGGGGGEYRRRRGPKASISKRLAPFRGLGYATQARPNEITYCSHAYNNYAGGVEIGGPVEIKAVRLTEAYDVIWQISGGTNPPPLWPVLSIRWNAYAVLKSRTTITLRCHTADATPGVVYGSWLLYAVPGNSATTAPVEPTAEQVLTQPRTYPHKVINFVQPSMGSKAFSLSYVYDVRDCYGIKNILEEEEMHRGFTDSGHVTCWNCHFRLKNIGYLPVGGKVPVFNYTIRTEYKIICMDPRIK